MVIVDTSVWIDRLRGRNTAGALAVDNLIGSEPLGLGDLILYEILQGVAPPRDVRAVERQLLDFQVFAMVGREVARRGAEYSRTLRRQGIQIAAVDCLIATFCLMNGYPLLTADKHFEHFQENFGLQLI